MKKALIVSTVSRQFTLFEKGNISILKELGYEVHCAANYNDATGALDELGIIKHDINIQRSPFSIKQLRAFFQLKKIMREEKFDIVHCHAPMGGVLGRIAAKLSKVESILYTAHGFHFYKGAPFVNNLIYKSIEMALARWTNIIITMNEEDYNSALKFKMKNNGKVVKIPGVGVEVKEIFNINIDKSNKRKEIGVPEDGFIMLSVGELIERKNHIHAIKALEILKREKGIENIYYVICGRGMLLDNLKKECEKLNVQEQVIFLGFRNDVYEIMKCSDIFIFPSFQEGLPKSVMEAMASGLPIIASNIRGNKDLVTNNNEGYLFNLNSVDECSEKILKMFNDKELLEEISKHNINKSIDYSNDNVNKYMRKIYESF